MKQIKNILRYVILGLLISLIGLVIWVHEHYVVPVVMYHHVKPRPIKELNTVTPKDFERQMKFLIKYHYNVLSMDQYIQMKQNGEDFSRNTVVLTFDDAYEDNYIYALPVLKKFHLPATEFVISDLVGHKLYMNWDQIKEMEKEGITIGSHTRRHAYLPLLPVDLLKDELEGSKQIIEEHLGHPINFIAYPTGGFKEEVKRAVADAGYLAGFTTNRGYDKSNTDLFELKRIHVNSYDNWLTLFAKFSGYYNVFRGIKKSYSRDDAISQVY